MAELVVGAVVSWSLQELRSKTKPKAKTASEFFMG
jgi:hypothetical protein